MISILILTLNEETNLGRCLESVKWSDDIVVFDSFSTDRTLEIARKYNARIVQRKFDDWASHQNWANRNIEFKHEWVYYSDADEVVTSELRDEMLAVVKASGNSYSAYRVRYRNFFLGHWIRHCGIYPVWVMRLFRPGRVEWERSVNPISRVDGEVGLLKEHFEHYSFNKGFDAWFDKHNWYSHHEASESILSLKEHPIDWRGLSSFAEPAKRRRTLKEISFRLPGRPLLRFLYMFFFRLGFLDGLPGFHYCVLLSIYEYMIVLKILEIERRNKGQPI